MSFSKTFVGSRASILAQILDFARQQKQDDLGWAHNMPSLIEGHQGQIRAGYLAVEMFPQYHEPLSVHLSGHASQDGSGHCVVKIEHPAHPKIPDATIWYELVNAPVAESAVTNSEGLEAL